MFLLAMGTNSENYPSYWFGGGELKLTEIIDWAHRILALLKALSVEGTKMRVKSPDSFWKLNFVETV